MGSGSITNGCSDGQERTLRVSVNRLADLVTFAPAYPVKSQGIHHKPVDAGGSTGGNPSLYFAQSYHESMS